MKYDRFESLPVWQAAMEMGVRVFALTDDASFAALGDLKSQLRRAALSVSNNIAEGFERGTNAELLAFLYIARGSAGEVRSMLRFLDRLPRAVQLREEATLLVEVCESCSRQLRGWAESLQSSSYKGTRYVTEQVREQNQSSERRRELEAMLVAAQQSAVARWLKEVESSQKSRADRTTTD